MVFSSFTRTESGSQITFKNSTPIEYVERLKYYKDNSSGTFTKKEFRWSFNQSHWANWEDLNQGNISRIKINNNRYLFFEIRYTQSNSSATVTSFQIGYNALSQSERTPCPPDQDSGTVTPTPTQPQYGGSGSECSTTTEVTNAQQLCGKPCEYYLLRTNHKGQQSISTITNLQTTLNGLSGAIQNSVTDASTVGSGIGVVYDKSGQTLRFKSIDVSGGGVEISEGSDGTIYLAVDASFGGNQDPSILELFSDLNDLSVYVDVQFTQLNASIGRIDSSINELYSLLDSSTVLTGIDNITGGDASIYKETTLGVAQLRPIAAGDNVSVTTIGDVITISAIDTSVVLDSSIEGVVNIGGGAGEVFSAIDSSKNIELRTIDGSGATSVVTSGDRIIISTQLTADTSITNIINVGTTGANTAGVLKEIDSSGVAELRRITGSGGIAVSESGDDVVLYVDPSGITVDPCTWSDTDAISADVGGLQGGDFVSPGDNAIEILEDILYEYFPPSGYLTIDPSPGPTSSNGYYEKWVGTPFSAGATYTYRYDNSDFSKLRIEDVSIYRNGSFFTNDSWGGVTDTGVRSIVDGSPPIGSNDTDLIISLEIGNTVNGIGMETYDVSTAALWVAPYFYGVVQDSVDASNISASDITALNKLIVPEQSNEIIFDVSANYQKIKFVYAYPNSYSELKSIFDVKNDFNVTTSFDETTVNLNPSLLAPFVSYKVYIKSHWISFTPDVSTFKLNFNI